jgi:hypothetical protein
MVSSALGHAGCQWQNGDPLNPARGLPHIHGLFAMSEDENASASRHHGFEMGDGKPYTWRLRTRR